VPEVPVKPPEEQPSDLQAAAQERLRLLVLKALNAAEEQLTKDFAALGVDLRGGRHSWVAPRALIFDVIYQRPTYYDGYSPTGHPAATLKQHAASLAKNIADKLVKDFEPCTSGLSEPKAPSSLPSDKSEPVKPSAS
jgi:hypothetical protein